MKIIIILEGTQNREKKIETNLRTQSISFLRMMTIILYTNDDYHHS